MPPRRRVPIDAGSAALRAWRADQESGAETPRQVLATAVRFTLEELGARQPGRSVEVRVPPYGVVQCVAGPVHRRGTPPNVVECDAQTWLLLATGALAWTEADETGRLRWSGTRADLTAYLPLPDVR